MANAAYDTGTATIAVGGTVVTFQSSGALASAVRIGDFFGTHVGQPIAIDTVDSDTQITLKYPWPGPAQTAGVYEIRSQFDGLLGLPERVRLLIERLEQGILPDLAEVDPVISSLMGFDASGEFVQRQIAEFMENLLAASTAAQARADIGANDASNLIAGTIPDARISATLPQNKSYRQGNIVGGVAQTGGIPTGAIINRGNNAGGGWVRFADGTQICWIEGIDTDGNSIGVGSLYRGTSNTAWTYPVSFVSGSNVAVSAGQYNTASNRWASVVASSTTAASLNQWSPNSFTVPIPLTAMAIGRWY